MQFASKLFDKNIVFGKLPSVVTNYIYADKNHMLRVTVYCSVYNYRDYSQ